MTELTRLAKLLFAEAAYHPTDQSARECPGVQNLMDEIHRLMGQGSDARALVVEMRNLLEGLPFTWMTDVIRRAGVHGRGPDA